jgi:hypothetical protein
MSKIRWVFLVVGLTAIAGCIETKDEFTINPDGSGKVIHELTFVPTSFTQGFGITGGQSPSPADSNQPPSLETAGGGADTQTQLKNSVKDILTKSSGVDTWADVSYKMTADGKMYFKGTAYFPDANNLNLYNAGFISYKKLNFTRSQQGEIIILLKSQEQPAQTRPSPRDITPEKLEEQVKQVRMQYQQAKPMLQTSLSTLKNEIIFHLPGQIKEVSNVENVNDRTARIAIDGTKLIAVIDRLIQDETWLRQQIMTGKDPLASGPESDLMLNEMLFGTRAPIGLVVTPDTQPLFDYNAEVSVARANFESILKELEPAAGGTPVKAPEKEELPFEIPSVEITPPAVEEGTGMKVVVGGVRLVRLSDYRRGIMPLGLNNGYTLALIAELPAPLPSPVVKVSGGRIEKALTDSGTDLLPKEQWDRKIRFPILAPDGKTVVFDIDLLVPDEAARGLEELAGALEYLTASGSREVDLGNIAFEVGAKGTVHGAVITSIEADPWQNNATILSLRLDLQAESIDSVKFLAEGGTKLDITQRGYASIGGTTTLKFSIKDKLPKNGRLIVTVFDELKKNEIPFRIANISLTGQPMQ